MKYRLEIKEPVNDEIEAAFRYYETEQAFLGYKLLEATEKALEDIKSNPLVYQIRYEVYRTKLVRPFPYHIIYEIIGKAIIVYQFLGARQEPSKRFMK
jgi:ParE toxin of type II toxin-antitoxin system, parDE